MIDLLSMLQAVLRDAGFTTRLLSQDRRPIVCFEDESLLGFGCLFGDPAELLAGWRAAEQSLLRRHALRFQRAGDKAWNVYCVLLCAVPATADENRQVCWIEEDLERTRKIAATGVATREDLIRVLLPLLPLQYQPALRTEDMTARLHRRIRGISPRAADVALDPATPAREVVRLLGEAE